MKKFSKAASILCLAVCGIVTSAVASECKNVSGNIDETIIPAPNDPFGRTLGTVEGVLNGSSTVIITSFTPFPPAPFITLAITSLNVFRTKDGDTLIGTGAGTITPIPGKPPGEFFENVTITIVGGSGKYTGATGSIVISGEGHMVFAGPGVGTFNISYSGSVCTP